MGLIISILVSLILIYRILYNRGYVVLTLLYCLLAPVISFGGRNFDSAYLVLGVVFVFILVKNGGKIYAIRKLSSFTLLTIVWILLDTVGWLVSGMLSAFNFFIAIAGLIKTLVALYVCLSSGEIATIEILDLKIGKTLSIALILNTVMVFLQWLMPVQMYHLCYTLYYSSSSSGYATLENMNTWGGGFYAGHYYRYFGLFETPMIFSCFLIIVLAFSIVQSISKHKYFKYNGLIIILSIVLGFMAGCKIFLYMLVALAGMYLLYSLRRLSKGRIIIMIVLIAVCALVFANLDYIANSFGSLGTMFSYFSYLQNPLSAFATRFGSDSGEGFLNQTLSIALDNFLTGVGPISVDGESIADSSYVILLHNGGIFALIALIIFYINIIKQNICKRENELNILVYSMLLMGFSRTILIFGGLLILTVYYYISSYCILETGKQLGDELPT